MPGLLYIKTFGCQMNEYDSGKMREVLEATEGMTRTDNPAEADVLLVNTCSVREQAQEKVFSLLGEWRLFEQVLKEIRGLASRGVREITLLGQNVNAYAGPMEDGTPADLSTLIHFVAEIDGVERIRFTTSHPLDFNDSLIEAYANVPKLNN